MAHFDNPNDKFEHMSDMWGAVAHILTFPMLTVLDKIGWHKTTISQLPFIGYVPLFLNSIIWVSVIFLVANKIIVLKRKNAHTSDNTE
ncbi:MAG: hypothetical protein U9Q22_04900 [Candidatus Altiarchaeota archaeon]|nr:hypothetical protein [Candidatus Altiarchaeota archaeon]